MKLKNIFQSLLFVISFLQISIVNAQTKIINGDAKNTPIGMAINPIQANIPKNVEKWIDAELAKVKTKPITDFDSLNFFNKANGRLVGYIKGYEVSLGFSTAIVYVNNEITNEDTPVVIQIHPDGRFEGDIPLIMPKYSYLVIQNKWTPFYVEPGQTLSMVLDWNSVKKLDYGELGKSDFKGALAKVNEDIAGFERPKIDYDTFFEKSKSLSPEEYKKETLNLYKESLDNLFKYSKTNFISAKATVILKNEILIERAGRLFDFVDDITNPNANTPETNQYYDFLQELPLEQQSVLVSSPIRFFMNQLELCKPLRSNLKHYTMSWKSEKTFLEYMEEENIAFPKEDKDFYFFMEENASKMTEKFINEHKDKMNAYHDKYKSIQSAYLIKYPPHRAEQESQFKDILMENWKTKDSIMTNAFGVKKNLVYDVVKIRSLYKDFDFIKSAENDYTKTNKEIAIDYWETLQKEITNPFLISEGNQIFNKVFNSDNKEAYILPAGKGTDIFNKIIGPFKGKIVLVDFWATSCGPCIGGIRSMKEIREKYEGNADLEFVFITEDAASPSASYRKFVKEQELKNTFVVHTDDFQYLRELFKFNGIPRSVVIDKNGKVLNGDYFLYNMGMTNFQNELDGFLKASN